MNLRAWLEKTGTTYAALGRGCGFDLETGRRYVLGERIPRKRHAIAIYLFTRGEVDPNSFYDLPDLSERAA